MILNDDKKTSRKEILTMVAIINKKTGKMYKFDFRSIFTARQYVINIMSKAGVTLVPEDFEFIKVVG